MNKDFLEYIFIIYLAMLFHTITVDYFTRGGRIGLLQGISLAFYGVQVPYDNKPVEFYSPWQCPSGGMNTSTFISNLIHTGLTRRTRRSCPLTRGNFNTKSLPCTSAIIPKLSHGARSTIPTSGVIRW